MSFKSWIKKRKEDKDKKNRLNDLTEEELIELGSVEKKAYIEIAKKQVLARGRLNAYKDFHIPEVIPKTDMKELTKELEEDSQNQIKTEAKILKSQIDKRYSEEEYNPKDFQQVNEDKSEKFKQPINKFREVIRDELRKTKRPQRDMRRVPSRNEMQEGYQFQREEDM